MKISREVGARIRRLRRAAGLSQADLAGDGLSASYISLLEAGKRVPSADTLDQLSKRLGCDPSDLTGDSAEISANELQVELNYAEMALNDESPDASFEAYRTLQEKVHFADRPEVWYKVEYGMARSLEHGGRLEEAVARLESLLTASLNRPDLVPRIPTVIALCRCYRELGDLSYAIEVAEATLAELEKLQLGPAVVDTELLSTLVGVYMERGDTNRAAYLATQAIEQAEKLTDPRALGAAYWNASMTMHRNGNTADALILIERALAIYAGGEDQRSLGRLRNSYAMLLVQSEAAQPETVRKVLDQSLISLREVGSSVDIAYCFSTAAQVELRLGNADAAIRHAERALELLGPAHRLQSARNHLVLAAARLALGDRASAQDAYEQGALMLEGLEASRQAAFAWAELAEILKLCGETERAVWAYRQSMRCMGHRETFLTGEKLMSRP